MKQRRVFVGVLLFAVFLSVLLPDGGHASPELPPEGWTGIYGREDLEKITLLPEGQYILMNDIDLTGEPWTGLCTEDFPFCGTLDGNGYSVYGMDVSLEGGASGFFSFVAGGTVKNLTVSGTSRGSVAGLLAGKGDCLTVIDCTVRGTVEATLCAGGLVGQVSGTGVRLENCLGDCLLSVTVPPAESPETPEEATAEETDPEISKEPNPEDEVFLGGLVGALYGTEITLRSCETAGHLNFSGPYVTAGGVVGLLDGEATLSRCGSEAALSLTVTELALVGGVVGRMGNSEVTLSDCTFRGDWSIPSCTGALNMGGIVGQIAAYGAVTVTGCTAFGILSSSAASAQMGGIVGSSLALEGNVTVRRCSSFATLSATGNPLSVGGICGVNRGDGAVARIENCHADGAILHTEAPIRDPSLFFGGICGFNGGEGISEIALCFSSCDMKITYPLTDGAVVGMNFPFVETGSATVESCYYREGAREFFALPVKGSALSDPASYEGFDFETVWQMDESFALPLLRKEEASSDPLPLGDVDGNRRITRYDGMLLMQYLTGRTELSDGQLLRADISGDGILDARDVSLILRNAT